MDLLYIQIIIFVLILTVIFYFIPKYVKKENRHIWGIYANLSLILGIILSLINYINNSREEQKNKSKLYIDTILKELLEIDNYLIQHYDILKIPFAIIYNKVKMPSSNKNLNEEYRKISDKSRDILFILFNKITYLLEKIYFIDVNLFDNAKIGLKIQLFINNNLYYDYWVSNSLLYTAEFTEYMNKKYRFLQNKDTTYKNINTKIYFIPTIDKL
jgi:hypothetical protein